MTDRATVLLSSLAAFFVVLALLATQLRAAPSPKGAPTVLVRRVYRTTVIETVRGGSGATSMTQSVSSSGAAMPLAAAPAPTTRTS